MERREDREGKWDKNGIAAEAEYTGRPKERRHKGKTGILESKCQLNEVALGGKIGEDKKQILAFFFFIFLLLSSYTRIVIKLLCI